MKNAFTGETKPTDRQDMDRYLRRFRKINTILHSFRTQSEANDGLDESILRAQMFEVRSLILSIAQSDEKMLLYYHYIKGLTLEACAKAFGISVRTAYRLKSRALSMALEKINK